MVQLGDFQLDTMHMFEVRGTPGACRCWGRDGPAAALRVGGRQHLELCRVLPSRGGTCAVQACRLL